MSDRLLKNVDVAFLDYNHRSLKGHPKVCDCACTASLSFSIHVGCQRKNISEMTFLTRAGFRVRVLKGEVV